MPQAADELEMVVRDVLKEHGCRLYHLERHPNKLEVYIEKRGGATLGDCERVSRALELNLAAAHEEWRNLSLEVSTPGVERRLYEPAHYRAAVGERVLLKIEGERFEGRLVAADEEAVEIELPDGTTRRFELSRILSAQVHRTTEELFKRR